MSAEEAHAITRAGNAWIGVSAQRVGVDRLRGWSPARYGDLDVTGGQATSAAKQQTFSAAKAGAEDHAAATATLKDVGFIN